MSKHISKETFYPLPSGANVHPCRLIQRDGTLMWKHALLCSNEVHIPSNQAEEQHIIKTAAPRGTEQLGVPRTRAVGVFSY